MKSTLRYTLVVHRGPARRSGRLRLGPARLWRHTPPSPEKILGRLEQKLHLTEDQKAKALVILTDESAKMKPAHGSLGQIRKPFATKAPGGCERTLDPKQQAEFDAMKKKFDQHRMDPFRPSQPLFQSGPLAGGSSAK
jgi:hypothetical protein